MARSRSRVGQIVPPGVYRRVNQSLVTSISLRSLEQTTVDEDHGWGKENAFSSFTIKRQCTPLNGTQLATSGNPQGQFEGFIPTAAQGNTAPMVPPTTDRSMAPKVYASSNPSRPYVDTGTFVGELRDFPRMAKGIWDSARKVWLAARSSPENPLRALNRAFIEGAKDNIPNADSRFIETQFGWLPFLSDVNKYMNVGSVLEKRYRELQGLRSHGTSSRRIRLDEGSSVTSGIEIINSSTSALIKGQVTRATNFQRWGVGKWSLDPGGNLSNADSIKKIESLTRQAVLGLTLDQSTAWNLAPWSWLIDWGSNMGDWIESSRNTVGASKVSASVMTTSVAMVDCVRSQGMDDQPAVSGGSFNYLRINKVRTIHTPFILPEMTIPILTGRQSAILGALMTMRVSRNRRDYT